MMARAARSFTLPPGCMNSALARIRPGPLQTRDSSNTGVRPMRPAALAAMRLEFFIVTRFAKTVTGIMITDDYDRKWPISEVSTRLMRLFSRRDHDLW
jgi:hypothetical protein